jgi:hypothetical protein
MQRAMFGVAIFCVLSGGAAFGQTTPAGQAPTTAGIPCARPVSPVPPQETRAPSFAELNAFSVSLVRFQQVSDNYLSCLDRYLAQPRLTILQRDRAIGEFNRLAPEIDRLWGAHETASVRFRDAAARNAKAPPPTTPTLPSSPPPERP